MFSEAQKLCQRKMFQRCNSLCFGNLRLQSKLQARCMSSLTKAEAKKRRNLLFDEEKKKQKDAVGRIQKIDVHYESPSEKIVFAMNKDLSTPYDCAKHISEGVAKVSALAFVDGDPWDMHRPFTSESTLEFLNLLSPKNIAVNTAFWRTCSLILGAVIDSAFKSEVEVHLHSFPAPNLRSGSFVYDAVLNVPDWNPTDSELRAMSAQFIKLVTSELPVERLQTTEDVATEMFQDNPFKSNQIPEIAKGNDDKITLYRIGDYIDISKGPMIGNTYLVGRCTISAVHKFPVEDTENIYRFQGVALPRGIRLNQFAYSILEERARKLNNTAWIPQTITDGIDQHVMMSAKN